MKFFNATNNFTSGEWSPKMHARTDVQQYVNAAETIKNAIVQIQGGAFRRPGTFYVKLDNPAKQTILDTAIKVKMIPFSYDGIKRILIITDGPVNDWFLIDNNGVTSNLSTIGNDPIGSAVLFSAIDTLQYTIVGNTIIITTGIIPPIAIVIKADGTAFLYPWLTKYNLLGRVAYAESLKQRRWEAVPYSGFLNYKNYGAITVGGASASEGATVSVAFASAVFSSSPATFTYPTYIRVTDTTGKTFVIEVSGNTNATGGTGVVVYNPDGATTGTYGLLATGGAWEYSLWGYMSTTSPGSINFPSCVEGFEQRLIFGNTSANPVTFWGSRTGNIVSFMQVPYVQDPEFTSGDYEADNSYPFEFTLASGNPTQINTFSSAKSLGVHTDAGEYIAYTANGFALGKLNIAIANSTSFGSEKIKPYRINNFLTFVQHGGRKVRDLVFSFEQDQYKSNDLSFISDHLFVGEDSFSPIAEICKAEDPSSTLYVRTTNNKLFALTLDRDYSINAWSTIELGLGSLATSRNNVKAICTLLKSTFNDNISRDYLYAVVEINNSGAKQIVSFAPMYEYKNADTLFPPVYLDYVASSTFGGLGSTLIAGLDHLEGQQVDVIADGLYIGRFTIVGGQADIGRTYAIAYAGIPYETVITPLPIETGTQLGSSLGITKRVDEVTVFYWNSYGFEYGRPDESLIELDFRDPALPTGDGVKLQTGFKRVQFPAGYDRRARVTIRQRKPWPCNILAVVTRGTTYD